MPQLNDRQVKLLLMPIKGQRVGKDNNGFSHTQGWDIRRYLNRVFGFAGWSEEILKLDMVAERHIPNGKRPDGVEKFKHYIVYRATVRLTLYDTNGAMLAFYDGSATGTGNNLPDLGDAHDMAIKTAETQALKRAAINLGDQFGLGLYNGGQTAPVVEWSMAYPPAAKGVPSAAEVTEDAPVQPEPNEYQTDDVADEDASLTDGQLAYAAVSRPNGVADAAHQEMNRREASDVTLPGPGENVYMDRLAAAASPQYVRRQASTNPRNTSQYADPTDSQLTDAQLAYAAAYGPDDVANQAVTEMQDRDRQDSAATARAAAQQEWFDWRVEMERVAYAANWTPAGLAQQFHKSYGHPINDAKIDEFKDVIRLLGGNA